MVKGTIGALYMLFVYACMIVHSKVVAYKQVVHIQIVRNSHSWSSVKASQHNDVAYMLWHWSLDCLHKISVPYTKQYDLK